MKQTLKILQFLYEKLKYKNKNICTISIHIVLKTTGIKQVKTSYTLSKILHMSSILVIKMKFLYLYTIKFNVMK